MKQALFCSSGSWNAPVSSHCISCESVHTSLHSFPYWFLRSIDISSRDYFEALTKALCVQIWIFWRSSSVYEIYIISGTWRSGWWAGPSPSAPSDCCRKTCFSALKQGVWKRVSTGWWFKLEFRRRGSYNPTGNVLIRGNKPSAAWHQSNYELAKILKWELCRACTPPPTYDSYWNHTGHRHCVFESRAKM